MNGDVLPQKVEVSFVGTPPETGIDLGGHDVNLPTPKENPE